MAIARGIGTGAATRAERFRARRSGEASDAANPGFAAICAAPRWPVLDALGQVQVATVALLLTGASALVREINGARLRAYAALVGDDVFDTILARAGTGREPLAPAHRLPALAAALAGEARQSVDAGARMLRAERFLKEVGEWPSI